MVPKIVRDYLGDLIDIIPSLSRYRNQLLEIYRKYTHPLSFVNYYMKTFPNSSRAWAGYIYRGVKYFVNQGPALAGYPPTSLIDPMLAGKIPAPSDTTRYDYGFRYNIQYNIKLANSSETYGFNFWVNSGYNISRAEVVEASMNALMTILDKYKLSLNPGQPNSAIIVADSIRGFDQYIPGL
jgi:hypothetical protein